MVAWPLKRCFGGPLLTFEEQLVVALSSLVWFRSVDSVGAPLASEHKFVLERQHRGDCCRFAANVPAANCFDHTALMFSVRSDSSKDMSSTAFTDLLLWHLANGRAWARYRVLSRTSLPNGAVFASVAISSIRLLHVQRPSARGISKFLAHPCGGTLLLNF